jgi:hypothetical protein
MVQVMAGTAPHTISRQCRSREEAECWAAQVMAHGLGPVLIDGQPFAQGARRSAEGGEGDPAQQLG